MEPLPDGWKKDRYNTLEAERIVAYWRYGAPHPGTDAKPSREARLAARRELKAILSFDEHETERDTANPYSLPPINRVRSADPWLTANDGWLIGADRHARSVRRVTLRTSYVTRADLETLCPGLFGSDLHPVEPSDEAAKPGATRASTTREDRLTRAILAALESLRERLGREPKADEVFHYLEDDPTGVVVDSTDDALIWESESGALHDTKRKTLANRISQLRKAT